MIYNNFQFYIRYTDYEDKAEIFLLQQSPEHRIYLTYENGNFVEHVQNITGAVHGEIQPLLVFPSGLAQPFLQAMADMLEKHGIRPASKPILENELTAVKYHLEDMRRLVFEEPKEINVLDGRKENL